MQALQLTEPIYNYFFMKRRVVGKMEVPQWQQIPGEGELALSIRQTEQSSLDLIGIFSFEYWNMPQCDKRSDMKEKKWLCRRFHICVYIYIYFWSCLKKEIFCVMMSLWFNWDSHSWISPHAQQSSAVFEMPFQLNDWHRRIDVGAGETLLVLFTNQLRIFSMRWLTRNTINSIKIFGKTQLK